MHPSSTRLRRKRRFVVVQPGDILGGEVGDVARLLAQLVRVGRAPAAVGIHLRVAGTRHVHVSFVHSFIRSFARVHRLDEEALS